MQACLQYRALETLRHYSSKLLGFLHTPQHIQNAVPEGCLQVHGCIDQKQSTKHRHLRRIVADPMRSTANIMQVLTLRVYSV